MWGYGVGYVVGSYHSNNTPKWYHFKRKWIDLEEDIFDSRTPKQKAQDKHHKLHAARIWPKVSHCWSHMIYINAYHWPTTTYTNFRPVNWFILNTIQSAITAWSETLDMESWEWIKMSLDCEILYNTFIVSLMTTYKLALHWPKQHTMSISSLRKQGWLIINATKILKHLWRLFRALGASMVRHLAFIKQNLERAWPMPWTPLLELGMLRTFVNFGAV